MSDENAEAAEDTRDESVEEAVAVLQSVDGNDRNAVAPAVTALGNGDKEGAAAALRVASVTDRQPIVNALNILEGNGD